MVNSVLDELVQVNKLLNVELDKETKDNIRLREQLERKSKSCLALGSYINTLITDYIELENKLADCMKENVKLKKAME